MRARVVLLIAILLPPGSVALSAPAPIPRQKSVAEQNRANLAKLASALRRSKDVRLSLIVPAGQKYIVPLDGRTLFYSATGGPSDTTKATIGTPEGGGLWILASKPGTATLGIEFAYCRDAKQPFKVFVDFHFTAKE